MATWLRPLAPLAAIALLGTIASCGGDPAFDAPTAAPAAREAAPLRNLAAPTSQQLFDWAEMRFADLFPSHEATQSLPPYEYRHYPATGNYVGVAHGEVQVLGPTLTRGEVVRVARAEEFATRVAEARQVSGEALAGLEAFDREMQDLLARWAVPGASLVVAREGRLLLARGYGVANRDTSAPVTASTLFRMASINKMPTAVAVLQLVDAGRLALDEPVVPRLARLQLVPPVLGDARMADITVRHLLGHWAGFDRAVSGDPMFPPRLNEVAQRQGVVPVTCDALVTDTLSRRLDAAPGQRYAYSNVGYCMLGKVIESVTGEGYESFVSRQVLQPSTGKAYLRGRSLELQPGETGYHPYPLEPLRTAAPGVPGGLVRSPYGSFWLENMEASGAWVATPLDVLRFLLAVDGRRGGPLLSAGSFAAMKARPVFDPSTTSTSWYGFGSEVNSSGTWAHGGSEPGVITQAVRWSSSLSWVVAFNLRPEDRTGFQADVTRSLSRASAAVTRWPTGDLFGAF